MTYHTIFKEKESEVFYLLHFQQKSDVRYS